MKEKLGESEQTKNMWGEKTVTYRDKDGSPVLQSIEKEKVFGGKVLEWFKFSKSSSAGSGSTDDTTDRIEMGSLAICGLLGALAGASIGFQGAGIGGAIVGVLIGVWIGSMVSTLLTGAILFILSPGIWVPLLVIVGAIDLPPSSLTSH